MRVLFVGHRVNIHWPCLILAMWLIVVTYSNSVSPLPVGSTLFVCNDIAHYEGSLLPPSSEIYGDQLK